MKTKMLDKLSSVLEKTANQLRGATAAAPTTKRMSLDEFVDHALAQIAKAAKDEPAVAKRRLAAVKRSVDGAIATIAKMAAEDTDSLKIKVDVETAFAPTKADGDKPMADLTTASDQSSTETPLASASVVDGDSAVAENLKAVAKALEKVKAELDAPSGKRKRAQKADRARDERNQDGRARDAGDDQEQDHDREADEEDPDGWPLDLNTPAFRKGDAGDKTELTWGVDPEGLATPKTR